MNLEEALALIEQLKKENDTLKSDVLSLEEAKAFLVEENKSIASEIDLIVAENNSLIQENKQLIAEKQELEAQLYAANLKLNELIKKRQAVEENKKILEVQKFVGRSESLGVIINEAEDIIKEEKEKKKRGIKKGSEKHKDIDFSSFEYETRYEEPEETVCSECGSKLVIASEKERYVIETIPAQIKVVKIIKRSYKCPKCNKQDNAIYYPISKEAFPGSMLTPSFASYILYHKYELGIPLTHLSKHIKDTLNIEVSKQSLADYVQRCAILLKPIYERMKNDLLNSKSQVMHIDETTLVVSNDPKKDDRKTSYVFVYSSSYYDANQINLYSFHESRSIDITADWLKEYKGIIICDDYSGYTSLKKKQGITLQRCFAHVRRRFADILKALPQAQRQNTVTYKILNIISELFKEEEKYKRLNFIPDSIVKERHKKQLKIKDKLYNYIFNKDYEQGTALYKAINYTRNVWEDLWTYMDNGYVELTNNVAERAVKPFVVQRKVFQTAGSYAGARYTTIIFSIIRTALINDIKIEPYVEYLLKQLATTEPNDKLIEKLLPYSEDIKKKFKQPILTTRK